VLLQRLAAKLQLLSAKFDRPAISWSFFTRQPRFRLLNSEFLLLNYANRALRSADGVPRRNADALVRKRRLRRKSFFGLRPHCGRGRPRSQWSVRVSIFTPQIWHFSPKKLLFI